MADPVALDFSFSRPTVEELQAANCSIVCVYVVGSGGKAITKDELWVYLDAGLSAVFIFEYTANDIAGGFNGGAANAQAGRSSLVTLGVPANTPLFFTADEDIPDPATALPYYQGAASVHGPPLMGDYAEGAVMLLLHEKGITAFHWLSESTSFPGYQEAIDSGIVGLEQKFNASPVAGTDLNVILKVDVGQFPRPIPPKPKPPPIYGVGEDHVEIYEKGVELNVFGIRPSDGHFVQSAGAPWGGWDLSLASAAAGDVPKSPAENFVGPATNKTRTDGVFVFVIDYADGSRRQLVNDKKVAPFTWTYYQLPTG